MQVCEAPRYLVSLKNDELVKEHERGTQNRKGQCLAPYSQTSICSTKLVAPLIKKYQLEGYETDLLQILQFSVVFKRFKTDDQ